jgi:hypothetical protein
VKANASTAGIALGAWKRYTLPLLLLTAVACAPFALLAVGIAAPGDRAAATTLVRFAWVVAATAWIVRYLLVGAIAPIARAAASDTPLSQLAALRAGAGGLVRAVLPCGLAVAAVAIGGLALAVPGLLLFVLLAMTGASERPGLPAPLVDSIEVARANLRSVATAAGGMLLVDLAIVTVAYFLFAAGLPAKPRAPDLAVIRTLIQVAAIGFAVVTPIAATALAAIHTRARR